MLADVLLGFGLDAVAVCLLAFALYDRRHGRRELAVALALVNVAVFVVVMVISAGNVGLSVGIGLFALLSMVRLRSELFSSTELAYVLVAIALAVANGIGAGRPAFALLLSGLALATVAALDHPRVHRPSRLMQVTLELVFADQDALCRHLKERLNVDVLDVRVVEIDYVRETTRIELRCADRPSGPVPDVPQTEPDVAPGR